MPPSSNPRQARLSRAGIRWTLGAVAYVTAVVAIWWLAVRLFRVPRYLIPGPDEVARSLVRMPGYYARHFAVTASEALLGLSWGFGVGLVLGLVLRYGGVVGRLLTPLILAIQVFPMFAIAPVLTSYLGYGMAPKVLITGLIVLLPAVVNTWRGLSATPPEVRLAMHVMGANGVQNFWFADRVYATPYVLSAWRLSSTYCVVGAAVGEFSGGSSAGLAHVILTSIADIGTDRTYAALLLLAVLGGMFYGAAVALDRLLFGRYPNPL